MVSVWPMRHLSMDLRWTTMLLTVENHVHFHAAAHIGPVVPRTSHPLLAAGGGARSHDAELFYLPRTKSWESFLCAAGGWSTVPRANEHTHASR